ncbi:hypothetical protein RvY_01215-2 [Ramazzottius varieornatus]|uniref:Uncharacterized protein n=1 Tax=Ramazzottius varieornatus TaxID=947166 RepID=A0A1D1ULL3_RAMVA|nr:hypothetical protein RvY_01215-2 [Ramazzottius varieornatus]
MSLPRRIQSSGITLPHTPPRPALTVGRGQPKSHTAAASISRYQPVIALTKIEDSTTSPKSTQIPLKRSVSAATLRSDHIEPFFDDILSNIPDSLFDDMEQDTSAVPETSLNIADWYLPGKVVNAYSKLSITSMFQWQADCLKQGQAMYGGNLVYSAPTSAGKTLVAEILLLKRVVETRKKGLFILPFVSLAREKMLSLQKMLHGSGIRVGGYMGQIRPKGGMKRLDIAVCTIEKANSLVNRMVEEGKLDQLGVVVVDELHIIGDVGRGHLMELLLTKLSYLNKAQQSAENQGMVVEGSLAPGNIQIVAMSATLPNLGDIATWLKADLFISDYRPIPLYERVKVGLSLFDKTWNQVRPVTPFPPLKDDPDHIVSLCLETVRAGHGILIFCPYKSWCESLAQIIAGQFSQLDRMIRAEFIQEGKVADVVAQLRKSPAGLDNVLKKTVPMGVSFHHAGLTMDEREIVEGAFRKGYIKVLIATTTLAAGVNLPARRVIIRSPIFHRAVIDVLTYYQMAGRAGRKGVDTEGESILICKEAERPQVAALFAASIRSVESCMLAAVKNNQVDGKLMQAALEIIVNGAAKSIQQVTEYFQCTLFSAQLGESQTEAYSKSVVDSLKAKELIHIGQDGESLRPSQLGNAVVWSGLSPSDGEAVFQELQRARLSFNLETDLHILHLLTPLNLLEHVADLDWYQYMMLWEKLPESWKRVGTIVGVEEKILASAVRGKLNSDTDATIVQQATNLRRFYCALILNELIHEVPLSTVVMKYGVNKGMLQALQQGASSYSGLCRLS